MRSTLTGVILAAVTFGQLSSLDQRIADLTETIGRKPSFAAAYYARGVTYLELRRYAEAVDDLTKAIGLAPTDGSAYAKRAAAFAGLNRHEAEIADLTVAIGIKPGSTSFYLRRANAYSISGHCDLAIPDYSKTIAAIPSLEAYRGRSQCRRQLGDIAGAEDDEKRAVEPAVKPPALAAAPQDPNTQVSPAAPPAPPRVPRPGGSGSEATVHPLEDGRAHRIGSGVSKPSVIFQVEPEYSEEARKAKWQGTVLLTIIVDEYGEARELRVTKALGLGLDQEAIEAVQRWVFRPGIKDGAPVPVYATIQVTFHLL